MVSKVEFVRRFEHDATRYFALLRAPGAADYWLFAKNGTWPNAAGDSRLVAFAKKRRRIVQGLPCLDARRRPIHL